MRAPCLVGLVVAIGCNKDVRAPAAPPSTAEIDALWRLAPDGAKYGIAVSPGGVAMVEPAAAAIRALLDAAPELASARDSVARWMTQRFGSPRLTLAELGLTADQGFAAFGVENDDIVIALPVADRSKFLAWNHGKTEGDHDVVDNMQCKPLGGRYFCVEKPALFGRIGRGSLTPCCERSARAVIWRSPPTTSPAAAASGSTSSCNSTAARSSCAAWSADFRTRSPI